MARRYELVLMALRRRARAALTPISDRLAARAEGIFDRLEDAAETLQEVARAELRIVQRLAPLVDDLAQLVRMNLAEARRRADAPPPPDDPDIIDV